MASRPRREALRGLVTELLREGFGAEFSELEHERYLVDNSGRIDVAWGATVIELKSDLRREERDVVARMPDYLADASRNSAPGLAVAFAELPVFAGHARSGCVWRIVAEDRRCVQ